jgi:hypothetical protein
MATRYNYTGGIVTNGLVLNLDAAKTDSYPGTGTTWRDLSGNSNNGTLTNGPTFSGIGKQASIVFDGVDDYVSLGVNTLGSRLNGASGVTLSSWIKISNLTSERTILFIGINTTSTLAIIQVFNNSLRVGGRSLSFDSFQSTTYNYTQTNTWVYFSGIINYTTSKLIIYVNGNQVQESSAIFNSTTLSVGTPSIVDSIGGYNNSYTFKTEINNYTVAFKPDGESTYERVYHTTNRPIGTNFEDTQEGKPLQINATVMAITLDFMKRNPDFTMIYIVPIDRRRFNLVTKFIEKNLPSQYSFEAEVNDGEDIIAIYNKPQL